VIEAPRPEPDQRRGDVERPGLVVRGLVPMVRGFPTLGLLRGLRPVVVPSADGVPCGHQPGRPARRRPDDGSHVHHQPVDGSVPSSSPATLATATPHSFTVTPAPTFAKSTTGRSPISAATDALHYRPRSTRFEPDPDLRGSTAGFCTRTPLRLACRTRVVWQYRPVPSLSRLLPPNPAPPGSGCLQLQRPAATRHRRVVSPHPVVWHLVAHREVRGVLRRWVLLTHPTVAHVWCGPGHQPCRSTGGRWRRPARLWP
jgi:hypothetical protein